MTTEQAIDLFIKRGSNNDEEDEAFELLFAKAQAFDFISEIFGMKIYDLDCIVLRNRFDDKAINVYEPSLKRILKLAFKYGKETRYLKITDSVVGKINND